MKEAPLVTVIIPTYKRCDFISRAIDSVLNQTYQNIEVIIIDDNGIGTDYQLKTKSILDQYLRLSNLQYIALAENTGVCDARNTGLSVARGKFLAFLDDDDVWNTTKLEKQVKKFSEVGPKVGLVYTGVVVVDEIEGMQHNLHAKISGDVLNDLMFMNHIGTLSSILIKREVIESGIKFDPLLKARNDLDFYIEIAKQFNVDYVDELLVTKYDHEEETISRNMTKKLDAWELFYAKHHTLYRQNIKADIQYKIGYGHLNMINGNHSRGFKSFLDAYLLAPENLKVLKYLIPSFLGGNFYSFINKFSKQW